MAVLKDKGCTDNCDNPIMAFFEGIVPFITTHLKNPAADAIFSGPAAAKTPEHSKNSVKTTFSVLSTAHFQTPPHVGDVFCAEKRSAPIAHNLPRLATLNFTKSPCKPAKPPKIAPCTTAKYARLNIHQKTTAKFVVNAHIFYKITQKCVK